MSTFVMAHRKKNQNPLLVQKIKIFWFSIGRSYVSKYITGVCLTFFQPQIPTENPCITTKQHYSKSTRNIVGNKCQILSELSSFFFIFFRLFLLTNCLTLFPAISCLVLYPFFFYNNVLIIYFVFFFQQNTNKLHFFHSVSLLYVLFFLFSTLGDVFKSLCMCMSMGGEVAYIFTFLLPLHFFFLLFFYFFLSFYCAFFYFLFSSILSYSFLLCVFDNFLILCCGSLKYYLNVTRTLF